MPLELIVDLLIASGYVREEPVGAVGEFSLRGGILDVFSPAHDAPHRIEFFGDTVDSIREFDADTQRSTGRVTESIIVPMRELSVRREEFMSWAEAAERRWTDERVRARPSRETRARGARRSLSRLGVFDSAHAPAEFLGVRLFQRCCSGHRRTGGDGKARG